VLDDLCCQSHFPSSSYGMKICYDIDMIRQSTSLSFSVGVSLQISSEHLQPYPEFFEDLDNINIVPNHEVELVEFEYQGMGQVYLDPMAIYMDKFVTTEPQSISNISFVFQIYQALCGKDQANNYSQVPLIDLVLSFVKKSEGVKVLYPIFEWLYWIFHID
jgi:hypothetical protein